MPLAVAPHAGHPSDEWTARKEALHARVVHLGRQYHGLFEGEERRDDPRATRAMEMRVDIIAALADLAHTVRDYEVTGPAGDVKDSAVTAGQDVLASARAEGAQVVDEAKVQGRRLLDESVAEIRTQASTVQARLADTVQSLTDELRAMSASDANGPMADLAHQGQEWGDRAAAWLRDNDLDQALTGVRRYAARNPWTFLALAGGAGLLVGRLARGLKDADEPNTTIEPLDPVVTDDPQWGRA